jgi:hypothetical protein
MHRFPEKGRSFKAKKRKFKKGTKLRLVNPVSPYAAPSEEAELSQDEDDDSLWANSVVTVHQQKGDWVRISKPIFAPVWIETVWRNEEGDDWITCIRDRGRSVAGVSDWRNDDY